ncbi:hypothetical protein BH160DRAFT_6715 [Burkholderia sp. H160]|nr:hypothetical protein BH160DRAFT_6715 [Burkholderia sp. H160]
MQQIFGVARCRGLTGLETLHPDNIPDLTIGRPDVRRQGGNIA